VRGRDHVNICADLWVLVERQKYNPMYPRRSGEART